MGIFKFQKKHEENIYQFDILRNFGNNQWICGYAIVNVKAKACYVSPRAETAFYDDFLEETAAKLEKEGRTQNLSREEAAELRESEAKKVAERALLWEAEQIHKLFEMN